MLLRLAAFLLLLFGGSSQEAVAPAEPVEKEDGDANTVTTKPDGEGVLIDADADAAAPSGEAETPTPTDASPTDASPTDAPPTMPDLAPTTPAPTTPTPTTPPPNAPPPKPIMTVKAPAPPPAPRAPPPPPNFENEQRRLQAVERATHNLRHVASSQHSEIVHVREAIYEGEKLGLTVAELAPAKRRLENMVNLNIQKAMNHAEASIPTHDKARRLTSAVHHAVKSAHDGPHVEQAKTKRNEVLSKAIDEAEKRKDLRTGHEMIVKARNHAGKDLETVVTTASRRLLDSAADRVQNHKTYYHGGVQHHEQLEHAIEVCKAEGIGHPELASAEETWKREKHRDFLKSEMPNMLKQRNWPDIVYHMQKAQQGDLQDPVVDDTVKNMHSQMLEHVVRADASKSETAARRLSENGTVAGKILSIKELEHVYRYGDLSGLPKVELDKVKAAIEARHKERMDTHVDINLEPGMRDLWGTIEKIESTIHSKYINKEDFERANNKLVSKLQKLLQTAVVPGWMNDKPKGFVLYSRTLAILRSPNFKNYVNSTELTTFKAQYREEHVKELKEALAGDEYQRIMDAWEITYNAKFLFQDAQDREVEDLGARMRSAHEWWNIRKDLFAQMAKASGQNNSNEAYNALKKALRDCTTYKCNKDTIAPYVAKYDEWTQLRTAKTTPPPKSATA